MRLGQETRYGLCSFNSSCFLVRLSPVCAPGACPGAIPSIRKSFLGSPWKRSYYPVAPIHLVETFPRLGSTLVLLSFAFLDAVYPPIHDIGYAQPQRGQYMKFLFALSPSQLLGRPKRTGNVTKLAAASSMVLCKCSVRVVVGYWGRGNVDSSSHNVWVYVHICHRYGSVVVCGVNVVSCGEHCLMLQSSAHAKLVR